MEVSRAFEARRLESANRPCRRSRRITRRFAIEYFSADKLASANGTSFDVGSLGSVTIMRFAHPCAILPTRNLANNVSISLLTAARLHSAPPEQSERREMDNAFRMDEMNE